MIRLRITMIRICVTQIIRNRPSFNNESPGGPCMMASSRCWRANLTAACWEASRAGLSQRSSPPLSNSRGGRLAWGSLGSLCCAAKQKRFAQPLPLMGGDNNAVLRIRICFNTCESREANQCGFTRIRIRLCRQIKKILLFFSRLQVLKH
jgi:hypothetical protein